MLSVCFVGPPTKNRNSPFRGSSSSPGKRVRLSSSIVRRATSDDDIQAVPSLQLDRSVNLDTESAWIANMIRLWLDEEWTPLAIHREIGDEVGRIVFRLREEGKDDAGDFLLELQTSLLKFNFYDSFTDAFEVGNKVVELMMMRMGIDVCCQSPEDKTCLQRWEKKLQQEGEVL